MDFLRKLPISYMGELHNVKLINFTVDADEVADELPNHLQPRLYQGRALISMVNVQLRNMKLTATGDLFRFSYQHVALRLAVNDAQYNGGVNKGVFFLRSFTDNPLMVRGGRMFTSFRLQQANISDMGFLFELKSGNEHINYALDLQEAREGDAELKQRIAALDRAYAGIGNNLYRIAIERKEWPLEWADCYGFETNLYQTARLEGAFHIRHKVDYRWKAPKRVQPATFPKATLVPNLTTTSTH